MHRSPPPSATAPRRRERGSVGCGRAALGAAVIVATALGPAAAARAAAPGGGWSSLKTSGQLDTSDLVATARTSGATLHVAWPTLRPNGLHDLMQTPVTAAGTVGTPSAIATGWVDLQGPSLISTPGGLQAYFSGTRTATTGDPTEGLDTSTSTDGGSTWSQPFAIASDQDSFGRDASVALGPAGPLAAWFATEATVVHAGTDPSTASQTGYGDGIDQKIAVSGGSALVAWCNELEAPQGVYVQPVDPQTGAPVSSARLVPGSTSHGEAFCDASHPVALVARQSKGFSVVSASGDRHSVIAWRVGAPASTTVAGGSSDKQYVTAAATPTGKASIWVGWLDDTAIKLRRSNASATVFGATVTVPLPRDGSVYGLDLDAQADRVDLIARVKHDDNSVTLEQAQQFPGLTLTAHSGPHPTFRVLDAGSPVAGATVTVAGFRATTGPDGRAVLTSLRPGRYTARATMPRYVGARTSVTVPAPKVTRSAS